MKRGFYPGSFDPPTLGHLSVIERASLHFDHLYIGVGDNSSKEEFFTKEGEEMLKKSTKKFKNVEVVVFDGLSSDAAKKLKATVFVRSLRNVVDFDFEASLSAMNHTLFQIDTLFFMTENHYRSISSTLVIELAKQGARLDLFVPKEIEKMILKKFQ